MKNEIREAARRVVNLSEMKRCVGRSRAYREAVNDLAAFTFKYDRLTRTQKLLRIGFMLKRWRQRAEAAEKKVEWLAKK